MSLTRLPPSASSRSSSSKVARPAQVKLRPRPWFVLGCILIVLLMIVVDAANRVSMIRRATAMRMSEVAPGTVPIAPGAVERTLVIPTSGIDGKVWVMHTEEMLKQGVLRLRHTPFDNHPEGREVHWSSGLMWLLAGISGVIHFFNGRPVSDTVPEAAIFGGPILLVALLAALATVLYRRFGAKTAAFGVLLFGTCFPVFEFFRLGDFDHHGLVSWFGMMSVLCLAMGGAGCVAGKNHARTGSANGKSSIILPAPSIARRWFIGAGIAGGAALWVSSATQIPVLVGTGLGAVLSGLASAKWSEESTLRPELWRLWGAAGCLTSLFFYALEYFPFHLGWRLEVNHPIHALAWLGAADLICRILRKRLGQPLIEGTIADRAWAAGTLVALALPPVLVMWKPETVFWVSDRFLLALHENILEFKPFFLSIQKSNIVLMLLHGLTWPLLGVGVLGFLAARRYLNPVWLAPLILTITPALVMLALAMRQIRWIGTALCLWIALASLIFAMCTRGEIRRALPRWIVVLICVLALVPIGAHPLNACATWLSARDNPRVPKDMLPVIIERDVVHRLIEAKKDRLPVILSSPTTSTELAYFGGVHVVGTLYWENMHGLKSAAHIFSASSEADARARLLEHGVTHILLFSWDDFTEDYKRLLQYAANPSDKPDSGRMFVTRLQEVSEIPQWIRPLYYPIPPEFELHGEWVRLYEVIPDQSLPEWAFHLGMFHFDSGQYDKAAEAFSRALAAGTERADSRSYLCLARIRSGKLEGVEAEISLAPMQDREPLRRELRAAVERARRSPSR